MTKKKSLRDAITAVDMEEKLGKAVKAKFDKDIAAGASVILGEPSPACGCTAVNGTTDNGSLNQCQLCGIYYVGLWHICPQPPAPMFPPSGWVCPKCGRVYAPFVSTCFQCGPSYPFTPGIYCGDRS